ncbi:MAG: FixJ family two-component response regulator [Kiritimatiellia bacterium]|jgi:FixJ family two-component response regulator
MNSIFILAIDPLLLESLSELFNRAGFVVSLFKNPDILLDKLTEEQPSCILAEDLSIRATNKKLIENIHSKTPNMPIILMASGDDISVAVKAIRDGATDFVQKPIVDRVLVECVRRTILNLNDSKNS